MEEQFEGRGINGEILGVFVTGRLVADPYYYPASAASGNLPARGEQFKIGLDIGDIQNIVLYVPCKLVAGAKRGDVVTIQVRAGRNGSYYPVERA